MAWGINPNAPKREKLKAEMNDYLLGMNSVGKIDYCTYSEMYDFTMDLLDKMYAQGLEDSTKIDNAM